MPNLLPLPEEGHTLSCTPKIQNKVPKNAFKSLKKTIEAAARLSSASRAGKETAPF